MKSAVTMKIEIQSISDVITNSSSEVFLITMDQKYEHLMEKAGDDVRSCFHEFKTAQDIKKYCENGGDFNDLSILDRNHGEAYCDALREYSYKNNYISLSEIPSDVKSKLWRKTKECMASMIGKAMCIYDDIEDDMLKRKVDLFIDMNEKKLDMRKGFCG